MRIAPALLGAVAVVSCVGPIDRAPAGAAPAPAPAAETVSAPVNSPPPGQLLYGRHCLSCHQADGGGVPNMQPPIKGGTWKIVNVQITKFPPQK